MNKLKTSIAALLLGSCLSGQALADEYYVNYTASGIQTLNISTVNTALAVSHNRVVHGLVLTNSDATPVTVTVLKVTSSTAAGKATSTAPVTEIVVIVPANSTHVVQLPSGLVFSRTKTSIDEMDVELTTTSSAPNVSLTVDFQDIAS